MDYEKKYKEALERAKGYLKEYYFEEAVKDIFPELKEKSEDERIIKMLVYIVNITPAIVAVKNRQTLLDWLENQGNSSDQIHYWTEEEIEPIISDYLRGVEHYGGMIARLRCLKPKSLEKQGEQKPIEWDADDDEKLYFLKARLKDYEDCIIYDEELSEYQKSNVRETTKEFLEWLDSIKERIGG